MKTIPAVSMVVVALFVSWLVRPRQTRRLAVAPALLALLPCSHAFAQTSAPAPQQPPLVRADAPAYLVGEQWTFVYKNLRDSTKDLTFTQTVTRIGDGRVELNGGRTVLDADGNYVEVASMSYTPSDGKLHFPMHVGDTWPATFVLQGETADFFNQCRSTVVGVERVSTVVGSFDTFKIERTCSWLISTGDKAHGLARETYWYAPGIGRVVKMDATNKPEKGAQTVAHVELTGFRRATTALPPGAASQ